MFCNRYGPRIFKLMHAGPPKWNMKADATCTGELNQEELSRRIDPFICCDPAREHLQPPVPVRSHRRRADPVPAQVFPLRIWLPPPVGRRRAAGLPEVPEREAGGGRDRAA